MSNCYNIKLDNYDLHKKIDEFHENKNYLAQFDCCDENSCDDLAYEYEKLLNKCHDVYSEVGMIQTNDKGRLAAQSMCDNYEIMRDKYKNKYRRGGTKKNKRKRYVKKSLKKRRKVKLK